MGFVDPTQNPVRWGVYHTVQRTKVPEFGPQGYVWGKMTCIAPSTLFLCQDFAIEGHALRTYLS